MISSGPRIRQGYEDGTEGKHKKSHLAKFPESTKHCSVRVIRTGTGRVGLNDIPGPTELRVADTLGVFGDSGADYRVTRWVSGG